MIIYKLVLQMAGGSLNVVPRSKESPFPNLFKTDNFRKIVTKKKPPRFKTL
jgi:hypothetical protein